MQINKNYIKAFTVQELLIGLVISSIIIGMVYTIYVQFNKQLITYSKDQSITMEFNQFRQVLSKDIYYCKDFSFNNDDELELIFSENVFTYKFLKDKIVRKRNNIEDEFQLPNGKIVYKYHIEQGYKEVEVFLQVFNREVILFENKIVPLDIRMNEFLISEY